MTRIPSAGPSGAEGWTYKEGASSLVWPEFQRAGSGCLAKELDGHEHEAEGANVCRDVGEIPEGCGSDRVKRLHGGG